MTLKFKEDYSEIGLIAVDGNERGKGVGMCLLMKTFQSTQNENLKEIRIITQFENIPAMNLYQKAGFKIEKKIFISHLWNQ